MDRIKLGGEMKSAREAHCEEVIIYEELIGEGTVESPSRLLVVVRKKDGTFIAERDPCKNSSTIKENQ